MTRYLTDRRLTLEFEEWMTTFSPLVGDLGRQARQLIESLQPGAYQVFEPGWGGYWLFKQAADGGSPVCWITAHSKHLTIGFAEGASLAERGYGKLLQGSGKRQRHVKVNTPDQLKDSSLSDLICAAWADQPKPASLSDNLEKLRAICLSLPKVTETVSHGHPTFRVGKCTFAIYGLYAPSVAFKASPAMSVEFEGDPRFIPTPYMAHQGWLSLLLKEEPDWNLVRRVVEQSHFQVAQRKRRARS